MVETKSMIEARFFQQKTVLNHKFRTVFLRDNNIGKTACSIQ